jgi:hypothetical protein
MIRFFAKRRAKREYVLKLELEAANNDINAQLAENRAKEKRAFVDQLNREADDIDANITKEELKLNHGYWICEKGHEKTDECSCATPPAEAIVHVSGCWRDGSEFGVVCHCGRPMKLIKLDKMTGQEKYEADREKDDAKKIAAQKRQQAEQEATNATEGLKTAQYFRSNAENSRLVADKIRKL